MGSQKKKSRNYGHIQGIKTVQKIIKASLKKKIKHLTLYTFSTENWKRPQKEINFLFNLLSDYIDRETENLIVNKIKIRILGNLKKIPYNLVKKLKKIEKLSKKNSKLQINVALNYGSRQEIIQAVKKINKKFVKLNEKFISKNLYTNNIPDPDILIRTGNRNRLSNFLLWQIQYSEIFFEKKLWPDFTENDFLKILNNYNKIKRNFGGI